MDNRERKTMKTVPLFAALLLAGAAQAQEVTIYKQPNFTGAQLTLRGHTPTLANTGFYDQAASLVVHSGRWEFCTQPDFKGECVTLNRGEYPALEPRLNRRIESAREVGSYAAQTGSYSPYGSGSIELYGQPGFRGRTLKLDRDAATMQGTGFDDRASSVVVTDGTWQLCSDPNYQGTCRVFARGRYADLGYGMAKQVSSARLVRRYRDAPSVLSGGVEAPDSVSPDGTAKVILFSEPNFRGESLAISGVQGSLERAGFDNEAESMVVESGRWTMCTEAYFRGDCKVVGPGRYRNLRDAGLGRSLSSIRPASADAAAAPARATSDIELFGNANFEGVAFGSTRDVSNLGPTTYNDKVSSVIVHAGRWELCSDGEYAGRCIVVGPGRYASLGGMNNQISSLRRVR
jgi:hypothetical protein